MSASSEELQQMAAARWQLLQLQSKTTVTPAGRGHSFYLKYTEVTCLTFAISRGYVQSERSQMVSRAASWPQRVGARRRAVAEDRRPLLNERGLRGGCRRAGAQFMAKTCLPP